jgi:hypothetical protein
MMTDKQLAVVITLATAFIYYMGWIFLYNYYNFFGIDIFEIGPSVQYTLIYAFPAVLFLLYPKGELFIFVSGLFILAIAYFSLFHVGKLKRSRNKIVMSVKDNIVWVASILLVMLLLVEGYRSAEFLARTKAAGRWMNDSNPAVLEFVRSTDATRRPNDSNANSGIGFSEKLQEFNNGLQLRFILSTPQFHYLFGRADCDSNFNETCEGFLFRVRVADVKVITILHPAEGKK